MFFPDCLGYWVEGKGSSQFEHCITGCGNQMWHRMWISTMTQFTHSKLIVLILCNCMQYLLCIWKNKALRGLKVVGILLPPPCSGVGEWRGPGATFASNQGLCHLSPSDWNLQTSPTTYFLLEIKKTLLQLIEGTKVSILMEEDQQQELRTWDLVRLQLPSSLTTGQESHATRSQTNGMRLSLAP